MVTGILGSQSQGTCWTITHTLTQYRQFRDTNQPTRHVIGWWEETRVTGGNPESMRRSYKLQKPNLNPRGMKQMC